MKEQAASGSLWGSLAAFASWYAGHLVAINEWLQHSVLLVGLISGLWGLHRLWVHRRRPK